MRNKVLLRPRNKVSERRLTWLRRETFQLSVKNISMIDINIKNASFDAIHIMIYFDDLVNFIFTV